MTWDLLRKLYGHDTPPDLGERLTRHGFSPQEVESVVVLDLADAPAALWQPSAHDLRRVTDPAQVSASSQLMPAT